MLPDFFLMFQHRTVAKQLLMAGAQRRRKAARSKDFPAGSNLCRGLAHSFAEKK